MRLFDGIRDLLHGYPTVLGIARDFLAFLACVGFMGFLVFMAGGL